MTISNLLRPPSDHRQAVIRIQQVLSSMPYGGICDFEYLDLSDGVGRVGVHEATVEEVFDVVVENLEKLKRVLRGAADRNQAEHLELELLKADLAATGRLLARVLPAPEEPAT